MFAETGILLIKRVGRDLCVCVCVFKRETAQSMTSVSGFSRRVNSERLKNHMSYLPRAKTATVSRKTLDRGNTTP